MLRGLAGVAPVPRQRFPNAVMIASVIRSNPRGWLVVAVAFTALSLGFSSRATLGLMIPAWEKEFGWSREFLSSGGAIMLVVMAIVAPLAGNLIDRFGPRWLFASGTDTALPGSVCCSKE